MNDNNNLILTYDEITGTKDYKNEDGSPGRSNVTEAKSINLSDEDAVERLYKSFLKKDGTAKTKTQIDAIWETQLKQRVLKQLDDYSNKSNLDTIDSLLDGTNVERVEPQLP